jgi:hypothetical protein
MFYRTFVWEAMPRLLVCVPYRAGPDQEHRADHLEAFGRHMPLFLDTTGTDYLIVVARQTEDGRKFNRGACLNAAYDWASKNHPEYAAGSVCFHDVDLLPAPALAGAYARSNVHLARCWRRYDSDTYLGGALTLDADAFVRANGFPNRFWGWGGEDDELAARLSEMSVPIERLTEGEYEDLEAMGLSEKLACLRSNRALKCMDKWEVRDAYRAQRAAGKPVEGLAEAAYTVGGVRLLHPRIIEVEVALIVRS